MIVILDGAQTCTAQCDSCDTLCYGFAMGTTPASFARAMFNARERGWKRQRNPSPGKPSRWLCEKCAKDTKVEAGG